MKKTFFLLPLALFFAPLVQAQTASEAIEIGGFLYSPGIASDVLPPATLLSIPFGKDDGNLGGTAQDTKHRTYGVPPSFRLGPEGSLWILDLLNQKLKSFSIGGKFLQGVKLPPLGKKEWTDYSDFCILPDGDFWLLSGAAGVAVRIDGEGKVKVSLKGLRHANEIGLDHRGEILIRNPFTNGISRYSAEGVFRVKLPGQAQHSLVTDATGNLYGFAGSDREPILKISPSTGTIKEERTLVGFGLEGITDPNVRFTNRKVLGTDAKGNVYVQLGACDRKGVVFRNRIARISPEGKIISQAEFLMGGVFAPGTARTRIVMPDGRILFIASAGERALFMTYSLP